MKKSLKNIKLKKYFYTIKKILTRFDQFITNLGEIFGCLLFLIFTFIKKHFLILLNIIGFLIITGYIANQLVQPVFKPRISEITNEPLYIQFIPEGEFRGYYTVNKLTYNIEIPLFPNSKIPFFKGENRTQIRFLNNLLINKEFQQINPYLEVDSFSEDKPNFYRTDAIHIIIINTTGWFNKNLQQIFYVYDFTDVHTTGWDTYPEDFKWSSSKLNSGYPCNVVNSNNRMLLGYGIDVYNNYKPFYLISIRSRCNLDVRNFELDISTDDTDTVCISNINGGSNKGKILVDLKSGEIKNILFLKNQLDIFDKLAINRTNTILFNWTYEPGSECFYAWKKYQQLGN